MAFSPTFPFAARATDRRLPGMAITIALHLALLLGWKMMQAPPPANIRDTRPFIQWISLPAPAPTVQRQPLPPAPEKARTEHAAPVQPRRAVTVPLAPAAPATPAAAVETPAAAPAPAMTLVTPPAAPAETIMEKARRSAGAVDRALRKANNPYIVAPLDSPEIRMKRGMAEAHALAPPHLWEAPKIDELVNQTGDGARRDRVTTALGTYCLTERSTNTSIDTIERHGKLRITTCPQHESTANGQEWRTARD